MFPWKKLFFDYFSYDLFKMKTLKLVRAGNIIFGTLLKLLNQEQRSDNPSLEKVPLVQMRLLSL